MFNIKGIDISIFQGHIDFKMVKASGIEIVIIKATQGISYTDALLKEHYSGAKTNGLKVGFYHYLTKDDPIAQAKHFLSSIEGLITDCKYIIDVEGDWSMREASRATRLFADYLLSKNKEVAIYTGDYFYRDNLNSSVKDLPLWVANYGGNVISKVNVGQQYSEKGVVRGINGNVDLDNFSDGILLTSKVTPGVVDKILATPKTGVVTSSTLNVRERAEIGSKIIGQLVKGDVVKIDKKVGNWYSIYFGNHGGYVSAEFVK